MSPASDWQDPLLRILGTHPAGRLEHSQHVCAHVAAHRRVWREARCSGHSRCLGAMEAGQATTAKACQEASRIKAQHAERVDRHDGRASEHQTERLLTRQACSFLEIYQAVVFVVGAAIQRRYGSGTMIRSMSDGARKNQTAPDSVRVNGPMCTIPGGR